MVKETPHNFETKGFGLIVCSQCGLNEMKANIHWFGRTENAAHPQWICSGVE